MRTAWFIGLMSSICLEGLGRKYLPQISSVVFYFIKDVFLLFGLVKFRPSGLVRRATRSLFRGFELPWMLAFGWTVLEIVNPEHQSVALGLIGLRAYWLWWLAPPVIAGVLQHPVQRKRAIYVLLVLALGISAFAAIQFASPGDSAVNLYSVVNGEEVYAAGTAIVSSTGRARVSSTFSFLTGFADFTILVPTLLLSIGLELQDPKLRRLALIATFASGAVIPMSGSRSSVLLGVGVLALALWSAGLFFTRTGRRIALGAVVTAVLAVVAFPDALIGVQDRFANQEETSERIKQYTTLLPPVALAEIEHPMLGIGTGMQQNARISFGAYTKWDQEYETGRYLIELGSIGYLLIWTVKLGLMVALFRAYRLLKAAGKRGSAAAAISYCALTMMGNLVFDHIWQALYFVGCGFILSEVTAVEQQMLQVRLRLQTEAASPSLQPSTARVG